MKCWLSSSSWRIDDDELELQAKPDGSNWRSVEVTGGRFESRRIVVGAAKSDLRLEKPPVQIVWEMKRRDNF